MAAIQDKNNLHPPFGVVNGIMEPVSVMVLTQTELN